MLYSDSHESSSVNFIGLHIYVCLGITGVRAVLPDRLSSSQIEKKKTKENMKRLHSTKHGLKVFFITDTIKPKTLEFSLCNHLCQSVTNFILIRCSSAVTQFSPVSVLLCPFVIQYDHLPTCEIIQNKLQIYSQACRLTPHSLKSICTNFTSFVFRILFDFNEHQLQF